MMPIEFHDSRDWHQVRLAMRHGNHHSVDLPACAAEIGGGGNPEHVAMPLVIVKHSSVGDTRCPRGHHITTISAGNHKMALSQCQRDLSPVEAVTNLSNFCVVLRPRAH